MLFGLLEPETSTFERKKFEKKLIQTRFLSEKQKYNNLIKVVIVSLISPFSLGLGAFWLNNCCSPWNNTRSSTMVMNRAKKLDYHSCAVFG